MNNGYQPFIMWKACESRFYYLGCGQIMEDAFPITDASAMQLREERRADFGENAQRIVDNYIHNAKVTRSGGIGNWNLRALARMSKNPNTRANSSRV
jgi:hypothetical protein